MKNLKNKKGFTLVELVIVIAVIAILAAVLIPTFSNVVQKANESKELQQVTNAYKEALAEALANDGYISGNKTISYTVGNDTKTATGEYVEAGGYAFVFTNEKTATIFTYETTTTTTGEGDAAVTTTTTTYTVNPYKLAEGKITK